jgi:hypothetical protein
VLFSSKAVASNEYRGEAAAISTLQKQEIQTKVNQGLIGATNELTNSVACNEKSG